MFTERRRRGEVAETKDGGGDYRAAVGVRCFIKTPQKCHDRYQESSRAHDKILCQQARGCQFVHQNSFVQIYRSLSVRLGHNCTIIQGTLPSGKKNAQLCSTL